jgi:transcriptional regulator with XRE-family HTH domain
MVTRTTSEDVYFGERLKYARMRAKKSQGKLAQEVGLTFQQIQKYEKGLNRISASRLLEFANILNVSIDFFYRRDDMFASNALLAENTKKNFQHESGYNLKKNFLEDEDCKDLNSKKRENDKNHLNEGNKNFFNSNSFNNSQEKIFLDLFRKISKPELKDKIIDLIKVLIGNHD